MTATETYANPHALVSTDWVAQHLADPRVRLLEVDVDTTAYERGHILGAAGINWRTQLGHPIRRDIPSRTGFEELMRHRGVTNSTHLVLYGDNNNWFAAFAYWVARMYGHTNLSVMNGGRKEVGARGATADAGPAAAGAEHVCGLSSRLRSACLFEGRAGSRTTLERSVSLTLARNERVSGRNTLARPFRAHWK